MVHPVWDSGRVPSYIISGVEGLTAVDSGSVGAAEAVTALIGEMSGRTMADVKQMR
jgi:hypothetical protein